MQTRNPIASIAHFFGGDDRASMRRRHAQEISYSAS